MIKVRYCQEDTIETDVTCDSANMLDAMHSVGKSIRNAYHWIPCSEKCYLVMDNAGGYRTDKAIDEYLKALKDDWNVEIIF